MFSLSGPLSVVDDLGVCEHGGKKNLIQSIPSGGDSRSSNSSITRPALGMPSLRLRKDVASLPSRKRLTVNQPTASAQDIFVWPADVTAALRGCVCFSDQVMSVRSGQTNIWINKHEKVHVSRKGREQDWEPLNFLFFFNCLGLDIYQSLKSSSLLTTSSPPLVPMSSDESFPDVPATNVCAWEGLCHILMVKLAKQKNLQRTPVGCTVSSRQPSHSAVFGKS